MKKVLRYVKQAMKVRRAVEKAREKEQDENEEVRRKYLSHKVGRKYSVSGKRHGA